MYLHIKSLLPLCMYLTTQSKHTQYNCIIRGVPFCYVTAALNTLSLILRLSVSVQLLHMVTSAKVNDQACGGGEPGDKARTNLCSRLM